MSDKSAPRSSGGEPRPGKDNDNSSIPHSGSHSDNNTASSNDPTLDATPTDDASANDQAKASLKVPDEPQSLSHEQYHPSVMLKLALGRAGRLVKVLALRSILLPKCSIRASAVQLTAGAVVFSRMTDALTLEKP